MKSLGKKDYKYYLRLCLWIPLWFITGCRREKEEFKHQFITHKCKFGKREKDGYRPCEHTGCLFTTLK